MIGFDPPPLHDILKTTLKSRFHMAAAGEEEDEPTTLTQAHWWVQPRWVKILTVAVGIPSWLYLWFTKDVDPVATLAGKIAFGGFFSVALLQLVFIFRGYWRMDI
jgi:hypothetical protein